MATYILKRILLFIPTLILITVVTFVISRLAPGDPAALKAGVGREGSQRASQEISAEALKRIREDWGLDKPLHEQYFMWASKMAVFDFGVSYKDNSPVIDKILERMPITLVMIVLSILASYLIAIPIGIYSATHQNSMGDRISSSLLFMLYSLPSIWTATLGIVYFSGGGLIASIFPSSGIVSTEAADWPFWDRAVDILWHLALPMIIYTYGTFAYISRQMRASMLEVVRQDYIRTARAKGLPGKVVVYKHALRNSLIPIITLLAGLLPSLIGGSIVVEQIFTIDGMGKLAIDALSERDYPIIMAELTLTAVLTMIGVLMGDILYSVVDPRISFAGREN